MLNVWFSVLSLPVQCSLLGAPSLSGAPRSPNLSFSVLTGSLALCGHRIFRNPRLPNLCCCMFNQCLVLRDQIQCSLLGAPSLSGAPRSPNLSFSVLTGSLALCGHRIFRNPRLPNLCCCVFNQCLVLRDQILLVLHAQPTFQAHGPKSAATTAWRCAAHRLSAHHGAASRSLYFPRDRTPAAISVGAEFLAF